MAVLAWLGNIMNQARETEPGSRDATHEDNQTLWLLAASPLIWVAHFLACYLTAAIWCSKVTDRDGALGNVRLAIAVYTLVALVGIGVVAWIGLRRQSFGTGTIPHDFDAPEDRHRFLGFATMLLSAVSAVATIFVSLVAVFMETCN